MRVRAIFMKRPEMKSSTNKMRSEEKRRNETRKIEEEEINEKSRRKKRETAKSNNSNRCNYVILWVVWCAAAVGVLPANECDRHHCHQPRAYIAVGRVFDSFV